MSIYRVKVGHDQPLIDLVAFAPQPMSPGARFTRRVFNADGSISDQGLFVPLDWNVLEGTTMYNALLAQCGLATATTAEVTLYARNKKWQWFRFNGLAVEPEQGADVVWSNYRPRGLTIIVKQAKQLVEP